MLEAGGARASTDEARAAAVRRGHRVSGTRYTSRPIVGATRRSTARTGYTGLDEGLGAHVSMGPPASRWPMRERMIFGEQHLRRVLAVYASHYNAWRPHRALRLQPPRPTSPVPAVVHGRIRRRPILGGLLNEYETAA